MNVILALGKLRQKDHREFKASPSLPGRLQLQSATDLYRRFLLTYIKLLYIKLRAKAIVSTCDHPGDSMHQALMDMADKLTAGVLYYIILVILY